MHPLATHRVQAYHCVIEVFLDSVRFTRSFVEFTPLEVLTRFFFNKVLGISVGYFCSSKIKAQNISDPTMGQQRVHDLGPNHLLNESHTRAVRTQQTQKGDSALEFGASKKFGDTC